MIWALTTAGLHADLKPQVVHRAHHPQVTGGRDVKLQPAFLGCPQPARLQQEQVRLSGRGAGEMRQSRKMLLMFYQALILGANWK